jgi:hypothetical protein
MPLAPYQGLNLSPGMLAETYSAEHDLSDIIYGPLHLALYLNHAVIDGASRDAGNTGYNTVLRHGLIMAKVSATGKWKPFVSGASDGTEYARGILLAFGLNTQYDGADADRFLGSILVKGNVRETGCVIAASTTYGLARTSVGLAVRTHLRYNISFSDDFEQDLAEPLSGR